MNQGRTWRTVCSRLQWSLVYPAGETGHTPVHSEVPVWAETVYMGRTRQQRPPALRMLQRLACMGVKVQAYDRGSVVPAMMGGLACRARALKEGAQDESSSGISRYAEFCGGTSGALNTWHAHSNVPHVTHGYHYVAYSIEQCIRFLHRQDAMYYAMHTFRVSLTALMQASTIIEHDIEA